MVISKILVIDDDPVVLHLFNIFLNSIGKYDIIQANSIEEALEDFKKDKFDLIFCDMHLPDGDGLSFLMKSKKISNSTPIVIVSADRISDEIQKRCPLIPDYFLQKPFNTLNIEQLIKEVEMIAT